METELEENHEGQIPFVRNERSEHEKAENKQVAWTCFGLLLRAEEYLNFCCLFLDPTFLLEPTKTSEIQ